MRERGSKELAKSGFFADVRRIMLQPSSRVGLTIVLVGLLFGLAAGIEAHNTFVAHEEPVPGIKPDVPSVVDPAEPTVGQDEIVSATDELSNSLKLPILFYHYIEPAGCADPGRDKLLVSPQTFEEQLRYLRDNGWTTVTLDDLYNALKNGSSLPPKPVILTFDDGYGDFYTTAWPIVEKYQAKVTLYVLSRGSSIGERYDPCMKNSFYMSDAQIKELSDSPLVTIGAHTQDHRDLKALNEVYQEHEIVNSKTELESVTQKPVRHFAYPYGDFNDISLRLVKKAGYLTASTTIISTRNNESTLYTLRRVRIGNLSLKWFAEQLAK